MTRKTRSFRPSPALVIGCMALFLALTGSALAVGKNSVRSAQIVDATVRTVDLRDNAVKSIKVADASLTADDLGTDSVNADEITENSVASPEVAPDSLTTGDLGPASVASSEVADQSLTANDLGPDSVGAGELGTVTVRTNSEAIAAGANGSITANCLAGEQILSGGGQPGNFGVEMTSTRPSGNGWLYQAKNANGSASTITAYALCLG
jgi:hypothetical protein